MVGIDPSNTLSGDVIAQTVRMLEDVNGLESMSHEEMDSLFVSDDGIAASATVSSLSYTWTLSIFEIGHDQVC